MTDPNATRETKNDSLQKLKSEVLVTRFWADPAALQDLEQRVTLHWECTDEGKQDCSFQLRPEKGDWPPKKSYTCGDGQDGVKSPQLTASTTFTLEIYRPKSPGHLGIVGTPRVRVTVGKPVIINSSMKFSHSGRLGRARWIARHAAKCTTAINGHPFDDNAPLNTFDSGYSVIFTDPEKSVCHLAVTACSATGKTSDPTPFDSVTLEKPRVFSLSKPGSAIAVTPDGKWGLVVNQQASMGKVKKPFTDEPIPPRSLDVPPQMLRFMELNGDSISLLDLENPDTPPRSVPMGLSPFSVAACPDRPNALLGSGDANVELLSLPDCAVTRTFEVAGPLITLAVNPNGREAYAANFQGTFFILDLDDFTVASRPCGGVNCSIAVSRDGGTAAVLDSFNMSLSLVDLHQRTVARPIMINWLAPKYSAFTADGKTLLISARDGDGTPVVIFFDMKTQTVEGEFVRVAHPADSLLVTPDGRYALAGHEGGFDVIDLQRRESTPVAAGPGFNSLAFSQPPKAEKGAGCILGTGTLLQSSKTAQMI